MNHHIWYKLNNDSLDKIVNDDKVSIVNGKTFHAGDLESAGSGNKDCSVAANICNAKFKSLLNKARLASGITTEYQKNSAKHSSHSKDMWLYLQLVPW